MSSTSTSTPLPGRRSEILPVAGAGVHRVEFVMGMPVIVDVCDPGAGEQAIEELFRWLHWVDATFSTYRPDSEVSRVNHGELELADAHPALARVLARCDQLRHVTGGYFDVRAPYYPGGTGPAPGRGGPGSVEPSGYVKGWAVAEAARMLLRSGARRFAINAGGDIALAGHPDGAPAWRVGIQHPRDPQAVALTLALRDAAVATSGAYARGEHVVDPHTGRPPAGLLSVTVTGPDLPTADAYATAAFAMGAARAAHWCAQLDGYDAILILQDDTVLRTPGIERLLV